MSLFSDEAPKLGNGTTIDDTTLGAVKPVTEIVLSIPNLSATSASFDAAILPFAAQITGVSVSFATASTSGTLQPVKSTGTTAVAAGTALTTATMSLSGTANTVVNGTLVSTTATVQFAKGDRLGFVFAGTMTSLANAVITVRFIKL